MDPVAALERLGGVGSRAALLRITTRRRLRRAVKDGHIRRVRRGDYALAAADRALVKARQLGGVASHLSAAQLHGWEVAFPASTPWITVPRNRAVRDRRNCHLFWADLDGETGDVTSASRTVLDCARRLPFGPALAVADSALRHLDVSPERLVKEADEVRGKGAAAARRVAASASRLAANPFESVVRALAIEAGLDVEPQVVVRVADRIVQPDLLDRGRRLVIEADSWEFHTGKDAFERDCWRYNALVLDGWTVLRFTWRQVMLDPDYVLACLRQLAAVPSGKANVA
ncbi:DUF559 domain-containing protein [Nocardioides speluncae]|uniref:DUF559 domain-containing protein n=1 Tax=Nocardioides speluncae TaxID=2670337 RepID=UPI000D68FEE1|nr:DUF559 domain-containing protein [Nocardioides speluncae]